MILAKYYTPKEGGHWTPFPFEISKEAFDGYEQKLLKRKITIHNFPNSKSSESVICSGILFSDGSIYDCEKGKYRSENEFPKHQIIEYMNTTLKNIYE